ncbi:hypothetical protein D8T53_04800 [Vibrio vulnificus]|nr:hypothetical protein D8T53_04800 [Vibrio vulnificus]HAS8503062.1 hypothetical protein [Vibrio vulnificus]
MEFINIGGKKWNRRQKKASLKRGWQHKISILSTCRRGSKSHSGGSCYANLEVSQDTKRQRRMLVTISRKHCMQNCYVVKGGKTLYSSMRWIASV